MDINEVFNKELEDPLSLTSRKAANSTVVFLFRLPTLVLLKVITLFGTREIGW